MCVELMSLNTYDGSRHLVAEEVHDYLTNNHHKKINRKDVINQVSITNKALSDMFKATPYSNFIQYLNHIRLEHCLIDILTSKSPLKKSQVVMVLIIILVLYTSLKKRMVTLLN